MKSSLRSGLVPLLCALVLLDGCAFVRFRLEDLPERPIAFLHWEDKAAKGRAAIFEKLAEVPPLPEDDRDPARLEEMQVRALLRGDEMLQIQPQLEKHIGRVKLVWPRTGEVERIEAAPVDAIPLSWSRDGKRLLLASAHRSPKEQLYEYHVDRKDLRPVTYGSTEHPRGDYDAEGNIYTTQIERVRPIGASAHTFHRLTAGRLGPPLAEPVLPGMVRVAPSGDWIVYEQVVARPRSDGPTAFDTFIATRSLSPGSSEKMLIKGREPEITPDGKWIVFASLSTAGYRLRRMRPDGTSRVAIGPGGTEERMPAISPDGEFIAFVQSAYGRRRLVVRRFDGKDERVLVSDGWAEYPVW